MADLFEIPIQLETNKSIIHIDMDAFYAQVEMRDHPEYRDQAVILANDPRKNGHRGVVATANYHARALGVHSAMNANEALKLAPDALFVAPDFPKYQAVSAEVHEIFHRVTEKVEPVAFDEAYLDISDLKDEPIEIAHQLQQTIYDELSLTCSVGISFNKFLAKLASEHNKPAGLTYIEADDIRAFLDPLPIEDIRGIGKKTAEKMYAQDIKTGYDLFQMAQSDLTNQFGKMGFILYQRIRGMDSGVVEWERERKSIGKEHTYGSVVDTEDEVLQELKLIATELSENLNRKKMHGKTLVLKVRSDSFITKTHRLTLPDVIEADPYVIWRLAQDIWEDLGGYQEPLRLIGLTMTNLTPITFKNISLPLYEEGP
ncbi:DNA polymerase IV [Weissella ceti]|uniref:DNA polymerase IV n=2 Tax=Weissella TaxID=46255 RepID=A0A075TZM7_9LACO|nr:MULTISPECIES: DNA polymerase IV [Weissella]AIG65338.1 DNA polymerase IV [Weissella tructae]AIM62652.1 DNA polymerase IV [Weissella ceti]AIM63987.1 DNA polymerase IV [Weissella ceti]ELA07202.1 DNA polymerase IV [Weissella ceti NC36]QVV91719.1 DNA polymerase IV [Weissella tructae]